MRSFFLTSVVCSVLAFAPAAAAEPRSGNAGCVAQFVTSLIPVIHPYGEFVSGLAYQPGPLGEGVSSVATNCPR